MERTRTGTRKKRKISHHHDHDVNEEEKKIEKCFDLIKSIRNAHKRLMNGSDANNKSDVNETGVSVWRPLFIPEDFADQNAEAKTASQKLKSTFRESRLGKGLFGVDEFINGEEEKTEVEDDGLKVKSTLSDQKLKSTYGFDLKLMGSIQASSSSSKTNGSSHEIKEDLLDLSLSL